MPAKRASGIPLVALLLTGGLVAHALWVAPGWSRATAASHGRDFASYYYAVEAAIVGLDPYDAVALGALASNDGTRTAVHPFLYPPPFLALMSWTRALSLEQAYRAWFWLDLLFLLAALLALWLWRPRTSTAAAIALLLASFTPIVDSQVMGQANALVLAILCAGMALSVRKRGEFGAALVGLACMIKPFPAVIVLWWLGTGQWRLAATACLAALGASLLALPIIGLDLQLEFFLRVLPSLATGSYGGLQVAIDGLGNHSPAKLYAGLFPAVQGLSRPALALTLLSSLGLLAGALFALRRPPRDADDTLAAFGALCAVWLLLPIYSFEHHMIFAIPAWVALAAALDERRLRGATLALAGLAYILMAFPLPQLMAIVNALPEPLGWLADQSKLLSLIGLAALSLATLRAEEP